MAKRKFDWTPVIEALKEAGRVVVFALISWAITKLTALPQTEMVVIGTIILRMVDKYLYEKGVTPIPIKGATGLSGF
jgi:hypothetical protein